jgi:HD-like signal output (HDOD) protein
MEPNMTRGPAASGEQRVRDYYRNVLDSDKLPSLPVVASKVLEMIQDPDISIPKLCRVLADDAALSARVLTVSRSPQYAQRNLPTALPAAVQVLGFRTLRSVVVTHATHSLCLKGNKTSERLWNHSLGVALAMRILCQRAGLRDGDLGFLTGMMHDVGQMILVLGDPVAYERLGSDLKQAPCPIVDKEQANYGLDHAIMGFTLLNSWNMDSQIAQATLNHHSDPRDGDGNQLTAMLTVADYLCAKCDLGFFIEPSAPSPETLAMCACVDEGSTNQVIEEIHQAYLSESALFEPA